MPNILKIADELVNGERNRDYGDPEDDFATTSELWEVVRKRIEKEEPIHVPIRMILLKISRILNGSGKLDNWTDIAGYAQTGATIQFGRDEEEVISKYEMSEDEYSRNLAMIYASEERCGRTTRDADVPIDKEGAK